MKTLKHLWLNTSNNKFIVLCEKVPKMKLKNYSKKLKKAGLSKKATVKY